MRRFEFLVSLRNAIKIRIVITYLWHQVTAGLELEPGVQTFDVMFVPLLLSPRPRSDKCTTSTTLLVCSAAECDFIVFCSLITGDVLR